MRKTSRYVNIHAYLCVSPQKAAVLATLNDHALSI